MIQRKQTIWLLISMLAWITLFFKPTIGFTLGQDGAWMLFVDGIREADGGKVAVPAIPQLILFILVDLLTLISIFLYKHRTLQLRITLYTMILQVLSYVLIGFYVMQGKKALGADPGLLFFSIIPAISFVFSLLAFRGIRLDMLLMKTLNRLR
jgi:hypothetical protein